MAKDDAVRLADTIAFIRTANVPTGDEPKRAIVAGALQETYDAGRLPLTVSAPLSLGKNEAILDRSAVQKHRHYRRAITLIRIAMFNEDASIASADVAQVADTMLPATLGHLLGRVTARFDDLTMKLTQLVTMPLTFLRQHPLQVSGSSTSTVREFGFQFDESTGCYVIQPVGNVGMQPFIRVTVFDVHVQDFASLPRKEKHDTAKSEWVDVFGARVGHAKLMTTTQLTGCAIVYHLNGATLFAAHVKPTVGAEAMCTTLRANGRLSSAPSLTGVFGAQAERGDDPNNYVARGSYNICIGVCQSGTWHLYAQQRPRAYGNDGGGGLEAWQIA